MKNLAFFDKILYLLNSLLATLLLLSFFVPYISPNTLPVFSILSVFVPFLVLINVAFVIYQKTPNKSSSNTTLTALGKKIGWIKEVFDGKNGSEKYSFSSDETYTGKRLEDVKVTQSFYTFLDWKDKYENVEIVKMDKVGEEEVYVVSIAPKKKIIAIAIRVRSELKKVEQPAAP